MATEDIWNNIVNSEEIITAFLRFFGSLVLFIILALIILRRNKLTQKSLFISSLRGFVQILLLGSILNIIFTIKGIFLLFAVVTIMIGFGAQTASNRHENIPSILKIYLISLLVSVYIVLISMTLLKVLPIDDPEFWIPIGGMITGNSMNITYLCVTQIHKDIKQRKNEIEAALSLGFSPSQVFIKLGIVTNAITIAITPSSNNLRTLGLVFIPGLMTGLLIGGVSPIAASLLQVMIFFLIFSGGLLSSFIASKLIVPSFFDMENQNLKIL